jgi:hypothetical protein
MGNTDSLTRDSWQKSSGVCRVINEWQTAGLIWSWDERRRGRVPAGSLA